ncbi:ATP-dependent endonuclease [Georgenia sp. Z1344]|uniref:ATP-dependent endonuclease n=1 Tax=Georgenia sp. Z1344 TaxID=3416706 RepID=UPI003CFBA594
MTIVLVEGESDAVAVRTLARRLDMSAPRVLPVRGSKGARRAVAHHMGDRLLGLVDAPERRDFERVIDRVFVCDPDLESELIRALGVTGVEAVIDAQGELGSFRRLQRQPQLRGRSQAHQLVRFLAGRSGNKVRYAALLAEAVALDAVPPPIDALLAAVRDTDGRGTTGAGEHAEGLTR